MLLVLGAGNYDRAVSLVFGIPLTFCVVSLRRRRPRFRRQAGELEAGLNTYLRTGKARRPMR